MNLRPFPETPYLHVVKTPLTSGEASAMTMSQTIYAETEDRHSGKKNACGPRASVSWSAVLAGAISIVTMIGLLSILGIAIGFSGLAMIEKSGASAAKIGMTAVIWMIAAQWAASTLGGYITGLRAPFVARHTSR